MSHLLPGTSLNRNCYKISHFIAQGGFGITYLAEEIGYFRKSGFEDDKYILNKFPEQVVVKELYYNDYCVRNQDTGLVNISNTQKRVEFEKLVNKQLEEGKTLRRLDHPNIVRTRDIFKENGTAYMVMDYVESISLEDLLKKSGALDREIATYYILQILRAVQYIHDLKILHLDITPSNILIRKESNEAVLIDFGASLTYGNDSKAHSNTSKLITGMKRHFAPAEQADIDNLKQFDATFDTYAIGATFYNLLTGRLPPLSSLVSSGKEHIMPPSQLINETNISEFLDAVVLKALAPRFHDRFRSALEFEELLLKEASFTENLKIINTLKNQGNFKKALEILTQTKEEYLETETLKQLKKHCEEGMERQKYEDLYEQFMARGSDWFSRGEYALARGEFEKAAMLFPERTEPATKIGQSHQLALAQLEKEKINKLLFEVRTHMAEGQIKEARSGIAEIEQLVPGHLDAQHLSKQLDMMDHQEWDIMRERAHSLFNSKQYQLAKELYQRLKDNKQLDEIGQQRFEEINKPKNSINEIQLEESDVVEEIEKTILNTSNLTNTSSQESQHEAILSMTKEEPIAGAVSKTKQNKGSRAVSNFLLGAVISISVGIAAIIIIQGLSKNNENYNSSTRQDTVVSIIAPVDSFSKISAPLAISAEDLRRIKIFSEDQEYTGCDNDMKDLHSKILNAPIEQKNIEYVKTFVSLFNRNCLGE